MRSDIQDASLRIQQHTQLRTGNDIPGLSAAALQVCSRSRVLSSADVALPHGVQGAGEPDVRLVIQHVDKSDLRGTINAMVRLIEERGIAELQRVGVLSQEGGMRCGQTRYGDKSLILSRGAFTGNHCDS